MEKEKFLTEQEAFWAGSFGDEYVDRNKDAETIRHRIFVWAKIISRMNKKPDSINLEKVYELMYKLSNKYIAILEYYNPTPVMVEYRGHKNKLWKRDFAGEMLDLFTDLKLLDYGFFYHRDKVSPMDDVNWFLLEKV